MHGKGDYEGGEDCDNEERGYEVDEAHGHGEGIYYGVGSKFYDAEMLLQQAEGETEEESGKGADERDEEPLGEEDGADAAWLHSEGLEGGYVGTLAHY